LQKIYGLDLNEWLRGERHWLDLWDFISDLPIGSKYRSTKLSDPEFVEALASQPEPEDSPLPLDGWDAHLSRLANIEDLLWRLIYVSAHSDPSGAPAADRPEMPHVKRRREIQAQRKDARRHRVEMQLIPGGGE
jgi:hypothetical protein